MIASANRPCVDDIADKDSSVANLTRMGHIQYHLNGRFQQHVAAYNGDGYTLNDIGTILDSTINTLLTTLTDTMHVMILKPVDVRTQQSPLHILELCLTDNCFNLFHTLNPFN